MAAAPGVGESLGTRRARGPDAADAASADAAAAHAQHFDGAFGRRFAEKALDALVVVRGARVLDVACGTGIFARLAAHVTGKGGRVVGTDPAATAVETARRIDLTSTVEWRHEDPVAMGFYDGSFDVVACQHGLHRVRDAEAAVGEMRRVLAPGGRLGIMTWGPIEENPAFAVELDAVVKAGLERSGVVDVLLDAFSMHRAEDLAALAAGVGLVDVTVRTVRMLVALPRAAEWVRVYPTVSPLAQVWPACDQQARIQFLARATELLRPFEHDGVLRVQATTRFLVARAPLS
ncbi:MAG TPA: methyltransferase domain-containing protein [Acidimicrobiales bacterium]|nr:methyltransferase domain-containing protein [Acidimicrobiales bacterium]